MINNRIYLDYNASTPIKNNIKYSILTKFNNIGNASSIHQEGRKSRNLIETAREQLAKLINSQTKEIIFTSGGTESNNIVLASNLIIKGKEQLLSITLISSIEHPSLIEAQEISKRPIKLIKVTKNGLLDLENLEKLLNIYTKKSNLPILVSVMLVNNETGVIQPIDKISKLVQKYNSFLHVDAVQALGKIKINFASTNIDLMSLSSHKIGGIQGVGALVVRSNISINSYIKGGGQELNLRAGTENVLGIYAFGIAANDAVIELKKYYLYNNMHKYFEIMLQNISNKVIIFGKDEKRIATTSYFAINGIIAEYALIKLDLKGIAISSGNACSSGIVKQSHVLKAMQIDDNLALCALRLSFGWNTKNEDLTIFIKEYTKIYKKIL